MPPVLHRQAEAGGHRRPGRPLPPPLRPEPAHVLTSADVDRWLAAYGRAWETADPDAAVELFTPDATYQETPFDEVMTGREAIHPYWSGIPGYHRDVSFRWEVLDVRDERAIAHWTTSYTAVKTGEPSTMDGIFLLEFDEASGLCRSLREWWHAADRPF